VPDLSVSVLPNGPGLGGGSITGPGDQLNTIGTGAEIHASARKERDEPPAVEIPLLVVAAGAGHQPNKGSIGEPSDIDAFVNACAYELLRADGTDIAVDEVELLIESAVTVPRLDRRTIGCGRCYDVHAPVTRWGSTDDHCRVGVRSGEHSQAAKHSNKSVEGIVPHSLRHLVYSPTWRRAAPPLLTISSLFF
jgi:hypothetical protein